MAMGEMAEWLTGHQRTEEAGGPNAAGLLQVAR